MSNESITFPAFFVENQMKDMINNVKTAFDGC